MNLITVDFETYYDKDFSLSKITTEEYVRSDLFEVIGVAVKVNNEETEWASGTHAQIRSWLQNSFDWSNSFVLAHNTMFDGAILSWKFDITPRVWLDTLCMGRAIHGVEVGGSLKVLVERYGLGEKGTEVVNALGKRRADFSEEELARYGDYCINDVELTHKLFHKMLKQFPKQELKVIDQTLRMFIEPVLELDTDALTQHLALTQQMKEDLLTSSGVDKSELMSNDKFAELLRKFGVTPPMKVSPATGKQTYAFAKTDEEFKALAEHDDLRVQTLVAARLGNKSTLEETRTQRFIEIAKRGNLPVPIRYYAAHTGRFGGDDKINLQNLPSRGKNGNKLKQAIIAPPGYTIIDADSAQIEARVLAWLAEQEDLVRAFAEGKDVYKKMAAAIYNKPEYEIDKGERFVGKVAILGCFGPDTLVLTQRGWLPIIHVQDTDTVWDGLRWVSHGGVVPQGEKEVWTKHGVSATSDHEILTERGWVEWSGVCENPQTLQSARAVANLLSLSGAHINPQVGGLLAGILFANVHAGGSASFYVKILSKVVALGATLAPKLRRILNGIGSMKAYVQTKRFAHDYSTESPHVFPDATPLTASRSPIMGVEESGSMNRGAPTDSRFLRTCYRLKGMTSNALSLIGLTWIKATSRAICASWGVQPTWQIGVKSAQCKLGLQPLKQKMQTYDIAYAGPRNRYTILTSEGPIVVHNCGYGMGSAKFQAQLKGMGAEVDAAEARRIIDIYRRTNDAVVRLWRQAQNALVSMSRGEDAPLGRKGVLEVVPSESAIRLPSGLLMRYDDLNFVQGEKGTEFSYKTRKGRTRIYGGKVIENVCQAIARCIIVEQMLRIGKRYKVVLTVHDAIAVCVPDIEVVPATQYVEESMRWVPDWAKGLPVNCESGSGKSYGDC